MNLYVYPIINWYINIPKRILYGEIFTDHNIYVFQEVIVPKQYDFIDGKLYIGNKAYILNIDKIDAYFSHKKDLYVSFLNGSTNK